MNFLKRKPKVVHHELKLVGFLPPSSKDLKRPVECKNCGKQFIMDIFGGWSIEWKYRDLGPYESLSEEDLQPAIDRYWEVKSRGWTQLGFNDKCEGR